MHFDYHRLHSLAGSRQKPERDRYFFQYLLRIKAPRHLLLAGMEHQIYH